MRVELRDAKRPYTSLCCIVGDEGAKTLARMLKSVVDRPGGPMVDEIVVGWNGKDDDALNAAIAAVLDPGDGTPWKFPLLPETAGEVRQCRNTRDVTFVIHKQEWKQDFAAARNENFAQASGVWRLYLDADDVVPDDAVPEDHAAIVASLKAHGVDPDDDRCRSVGPPKTLNEFLRGLDPAINVVIWPYDYTIGGDGVALERHPRRRVFRWADGFMWYGEYHEDVRPTGGNVERAAYNAALPIRHYPLQSVVDRTARNRAILIRLAEEANAGLRSVDARLHYNVACFHIQDGDHAKAAAAIETAIRSNPDALDLIVYRHLRAKSLMRLRRHADAASEGFALVVERPEAKIGWLLLQEVAHAEGRWQACLDFYAIAATRGNIAVALDKPVEREVHARVMCANAAYGLGRYDEALRYATEAHEANQADAFARDCLRRMREAAATAKRIEASLLLASGYVADRDRSRAIAALQAVPPGYEDDPRVQAALRAASQIVAPADAPPLPIFQAPSPWARYAGQWALRTGQKRVALAGRPHPDDVAALRRIVPETEWIESEALDVPIVSVDETTPLRHEAAIVTWPAPGVPDPGRVAAPGMREALDLDPSHRIEDLRLVRPSRPDSDVARFICRMGEAHDGRRITIYVPHFIESFGPDSVHDGGCGGSEEAVVYLSAALARRGHRVTVYGAHDPPGGLEVRDGVLWQHAGRFRIDGDHGILIAHRAPWVAQHSELCGGGKAYDVWVWHHDHDYHDDGALAASCRTLGHLFVSEWQRRQLACVAGIEADAIRGAIVGNGVPLEEFAGLTAPRDPHRAIYASQPQRGLPALLRAWAHVVAEIPDASLHVYYGWQTIEFLARSSGQEELWQAIREVRDLLARTPRVEMHGRVPQSQLAAEMARSGVWAYQTLYPEVSCIAGMRAVAAGCVPIFSATAALPETQPDHTYMLPSDATPKRFAEAIVAAMRDETYDRRGNAERMLRDNSWDRVAERVEAAITKEG